MSQDDSGIRLEAIVNSRLLFASKQILFATVNHGTTVKPDCRNKQAFTSPKTVGVLTFNMEGL